MAQPFTAECRIVIPYVNDGLTHVAHFYVINDNLAGDSDQVRLRGAGGTQDFADCALSLAKAMSYLFDPSVTPGTALMQKLVSGSWLPIHAEAVTFPNEGGAVRVASQATLVLRDTGFAKIKVVVLEHNQDHPEHLSDPTAGTTVEDNFIGAFLSTSGASPKIWDFLVSREELYLASSPFVGFTTTENRKVRRARGLT